MTSPEFDWLEMIGWEGIAFVAFVVISILFSITPTIKKAVAIARSALSDT